MLLYFAKQITIIWVFGLFISCKQQHSNKEIINGQLSQRIEDNNVMEDSLHKLIKNYLPDTSFLVENQKNLSKYIFDKQREVKIFLDSLGTNSNTDVEIEEFITKCNILFDDHQQYLWFKAVKKSSRDLKAIVMLSFTSPYSKLVSISERKELFKSFPASIQNSTQGKKTWKILEEYSYNNIGKNFFTTTLWAVDRKGEKIAINNLLKESNKKYLVLFGASFCGPCIVQEKYLASQFSKLDTTNYEIIGLSTDESSAKWFKYVERENLPWRTYVIDLGISNPIVLNLKFDGVPRNFLIDDKGIILEEHTDFRMFRNTVF